MAKKKAAKKAGSLRDRIANRRRMIDQASGFGPTPAKKKKAARKKKM